MIKLEYTVRLVTPAFLGNAEQQAQWRTPPFKALLRQWWRVASTKRFDYDHARMREAEGELFGNAWLMDAQGRPNHRKSRISLRLDHWMPGQMTSQVWPGGPIESVTTTADGKGSVRSDVYLGFGPVLPPSKKEHRPVVTIRGAIDTDKTAVLRLFPDISEDVRKALQLIAWFGTVGSRSRNAWGSLSLTALNGSPTLTSVPSTEDALLKEVGRAWTQCFDRDWPHALGERNGKPLIWLSKPFENWRKAMGCLANVRVETRRTAKKFVGPDRVGGIHLLGYPAGGKWELPAFKKGRDEEEGRLATQLRFKVCAMPAGWVAMVYHMSHRFPDVLRRRLNSAQQHWLTDNEQKVWEAVHDALDGMKSRITPFGGAGK